MFDDRDLKLDVTALALLAAVVFLAIALFTYSPADPPSALTYPPATEINNACGRFGALVAHLLLSGLGVGAYYSVISLAVLDGLLLMRRPVDQPVCRTIGWIFSLVGLTTMTALLLPNVSPGPVIGPGGYLGAAGLGLLEMHFASAGTFILTLSIILAGLLLCTDYILIRGAARALGISGQVLSALSGKLAQYKAEPSAAGARAAAVEKKSSRKKAAVAALEDEDDEADVYWTSPSSEAESEYEYEEEAEYEEEEPDAPAIRVRTPQADMEEEAEEEAEEAPVAVAARAAPAKKGKASVKKRLADKLKIRKPSKSGEDPREEMIDQLEAASRNDDPIDYELPPIDLLLPAEDISFEEHEKEVRRKAKLLEKTFESFGFNVKVVEIETGPVIAQYEVQLEAGLRLSKITSLADDLAIALRVPSVRIVAPIPGKNTVGIEVPNETRHLVRLREVMEEANGRAKRLNIPVFLGKDVSGKSMVVDLASMPHLLIAGRTGTGKSVCLNSLIVSMIMTRSPDEVRMLMVDPKMVELSPYKRLPHLMHPVVTDMRKAEAIMAWAVDKMEERYALLARAGVRHITSYNQLGEEELLERLQPETEEEKAEIPRHLPFIVVVADEIADLMMTAGKEVEQHIIRLAQKSRAVGIHLILATQKPTVDVITGLIKSNLPARIAFQVSSRTDSRVVLDEMGADKLLGNGDMLFLQPGTSMLLRGQGTFLGDEEINRVVDFVATSEPQFVKELVQLKPKDEQGGAGPGKLKNRDELYEAAVDVIVREGRGSVSLLQRALGIGYGRGARLIDFMAEDGIVGAYNGSQAREVLISLDDWEAMRNGESPEAASPAPPKPKRTNKITPLPDDDEDEVEDEAADEEEADWEEEESDEYEEEEYDEEYEEEDDADSDEEYEYEYEEDEYEDEEEEEEEEEDLEVKPTAKRRRGA